MSVWQDQVSGGQAHPKGLPPTFYSWCSGPSLGSSLAEFTHDNKKKKVQNVSCIILVILVISN